MSPGASRKSSTFASRLKMLTYLHRLTLEETVITNVIRVNALSPIEIDPLDFSDDEETLP